VLPIEQLESVLESVRASLEGLGLALIGETRSPIEGRGGNTEVLWRLRPR
jgi:predicted rRNA methylase YqxC with S4 and FtsJ domains